MKYLWYYDFPIGRLGIAGDGAGITDIFIVPDAEGQPDISGIKQGKEQIQTEETELLRMAAGQLSEYFAGRRKQFELPLSVHGTDFQKSVWRALQEIPWGETRSYGQIAARIGNPKACRAVGMANHHNRLMIVIPCHRVIGADGKMTGYAGGIPVKEWLLALEHGKENR